MNIIPVTPRQLKAFLDFPDQLYRGDPCYVPYMRGDLKRTLKKLLFSEKTYRALLAQDDTGKTLGRVLFTVDKNKQLQTDRCGFFSFYECVDDSAVSGALLSAMEKALRQMGAEAISGTYFPYDPDNRRGIMIRGFERAPLIFTSYNKPYYDRQMAEAGLEKQTDTFEYSGCFSPESEARFRRLGELAQKRFGFHIDTVDLKKPEKDIEDVCRVMQEASTEINYQEAPSREMIEQIFREWKSFLDPSLILIARSDADQRAIGIAVGLPDYFQVFQKMRGRMDLRGLWVLLTERKKIHGYRGILQYVIPEYQKLGVLPALYIRMNEAAAARGMDYSEAGTIMENNRSSYAPLEAAGAERTRIYRIYGKSLKGAGYD